MTDVLIVSCPGIVTSTPVLAPAVLKSCAVKAGFAVKAFDLNQEVLHYIKTKYETTFVMSKKTLDITKDALDFCINRIKSEMPKLVAVSILANESQMFAKFLCYRIKKELKIPVVIGGSGIKTFIAEDGMTFPESLKKSKIIDDYVNGDGEESFVAYLQGNLEYPGINSHTWEPIRNLENYPFPDFDDYDFSLYLNKGIPICDSRGCVRTCEFCDIIEHWKKYQYRSAEHIFSEMMSQKEKYGKRHFLFYNSLTNGNMREFTKLLDLMCDYNEVNPTAQLSWSGYFIVRNSKSHPEKVWEKIAKSNGYLELGIESVIEQVRINLGKKFYNVDIDYHLEMAEKYKVPLSLLLIIGYPTETKEDFNFTYNWFVERNKYFGSPIKQVVMSLCSILPNTRLDRNTKNKNIKQGDIPTVWLLPETNVSLADRADHFEKLQTYLKLYNLIDRTSTEYFELSKQEFEFFMENQFE